ncbi:MAG: urease subunit alpha [Clostridiales Family XIII bacterium]|jgi:urease subunit alpha|nr:urease subunit alpha [Clostridiales Family XIII bacterium]
MSFTINRREYGDIFGPTKGDKIHLSDTGLIAEIKDDYTVYGDEAVAGGGKTIRDGMGQKPGITSDEGGLDTVITNMVILDPILGVVKGDIGIKDGRIVGVGKAGNPDVMDITPGLIISASTEIITGDHGMIATAGGIDVHVHFEAPGQAWEALSNGLTTMLGGGNGGKTLSIEAPGRFNLHRMIESFEGLPMNGGILGRGNSCLPNIIREQAESGAIGMKIHEDWLASPAVIDSCLKVADEYDFQVQIHTDTLNESGFVESTLDAIAGRTMHAYHTEGAGGGHAPDVIKVCGERNILPSSTNPTNPYTVNTLDEHLDMIMIAHHLNPRVPEDIAFADSRIRGETIAAEDVLHDLGAISMLGSDSQGMGRVGESILRTWQLASKMKRQRGPLKEEEQGSDNERILRYLAKYTINPAITFGVSEYIGSLETGKIADIVIWKAEFFGAKPEMVLKSGFLVWSPSGDANASLPWCEPVLYRPQYGAFGGNPDRLSKIFVTEAAIRCGLADQLPGSAGKLLPVRNTRSLTKADMIRNHFCPNITVDPETYKVMIDGEHITCEPSREVALGQRYFFR